MIYSMSSEELIEVAKRNGKVKWKLSGLVEEVSFWLGQVFAKQPDHYYKHRIVLRPGKLFACEEFVSPNQVCAPIEKEIVHRELINFQSDHRSNVDNYLREKTQIYHAENGMIVAAAAKTKQHFQRTLLSWPYGKKLSYNVNRKDRCLEFFWEDTE